MTNIELYRILCVSLISLIVAWSVFSRNDEESGIGNTDSDKPRYMPYIHGSLLPTYVLIMFAAAIIFRGIRSASEITLSMIFGIFINISIYYVVLILILPFLRKYIKARTCAMLWLIPNYLYIGFHGINETQRPEWIIRISEKLVWILFGVWLIGFIGILLWNVAAHLKFRTRILNDASAVTDEEMLDLWKNEMIRARIKKPKYKLVISPNITTPLSVGLFQSTMIVVLPDRNYTKEELILIFRHEIIHIGRGDSWQKFFMMFCTAMCWMNPLMWMAMRKSAEDMELSCDETVLLDSDEDIRRRYAKMLLNTAGNESGFTTCLSASAEALRYRLKNIIAPKKRFSGALVVGILFFALYISCGYVALAFEGSTGAEVLYQSEDISLYSLEEVTRLDDSYNNTYECVDEKSLHKYMAGLNMEYLVGEYSFTDSEQRFRMQYDTPDGIMFLYLYDDWIEVLSLNNDLSSQYYLPEGIDWEYLNTLLVAHPVLNVSIVESEMPHEVKATLQTLGKKQNGETVIVYEKDYPIEDVSGFFGYYEAEEVKFSFSTEPMTYYLVEIESWDRQSSYTISQSELEQSDTIPIADGPSHYTVYASFHGQNNEIYEAKFQFNIGYLGMEER